MRRIKIEMMRNDQGRWLWRMSKSNNEHICQTCSEDGFATWREALNDVQKFIRKIQRFDYELVYLPEMLSRRNDSLPAKQ